MSKNNQPIQEDEIDLRALFFMLLQYYKSIIFATVLGVGGAYFYIWTTLPVYSTNASLQVESSGGGSELLLGDLAGFDAKSQVSTEIEIIKSRMILGQVADNLKLNIGLSPDDLGYFNKEKQLLINYDKSGVTYANNKETLTIKEFKVSDDLLDKTFELKIYNDNKYQLTLLDSNTKYLFFKGKKTKEPFVKKSKQGNVTLDFSHKNITNKTFLLIKKGLLTSTNELYSTLSASEKGKGTGILVLNMQGVNKKKITDTLNEIINIYVAKNLDKKSAEKEKTLEFLNKQLPEIKQKLELSERKFNVFRDKNKTLNVDKEAEILLEQNISLEKARLELEQKRAELSTRFTDEYPLLRKIDDQLDVVMAKKARVGKRLKVMPDLQQQYLQLYRDVKINTELYTNMLDNYQKLKIAQSGEVGNVYVIDKAVAPLSAIKPKKSLIIIIGTLLGLFTGIAFALLRRLFNFGVKDSTDLEIVTGIPVLANIPQSNIQTKFFFDRPAKHFKKVSKLFSQLVRKIRYWRKPEPDSKLLFSTMNEDIAIEALRSLRTSLFFSMQDAKNNVIMITGASPGIGKSFITANFAALLAEAGNKVVVVDVDLRRGYLHDFFGGKNSQGVFQFAEKVSKLKASNENYVIQPSDIDLDTIRHNVKNVDNLEFIPRGRNTNHRNSSNTTTNILMSDEFNALIARLSQEYDYVVLDTPPVLAVTDSQLIGKLASTTLFVTRYGKSHLGEVKLAIERLQSNGVDVTGIVFNSIMKEGGGSGYNYQYGYGYSSKK